MQSVAIRSRLSLVAALAAMLIVGVSPGVDAFAQTAPPAASTPAPLTEPVIRSLQEALIKQGIAVKVDGILNDETRSAIRRYQSLHHLPVTGEPDKATLDKLGVRVAAATGQPSTAGQSASQTTPPAAQTPQGGMMMNCPMMQGQMDGMMQMMQGMMKMMQMMQGQMQGMPMQPGSMPPAGK
ncbi:MAG: peptidoglycan-binding protein [Xanthobacteraceae bacterium]|nr:peptidoglycan-binding protein [Xanthobacteraceae bacterium]